MHHDYVHSKILADNNIKPESVERQLALDDAWEKLREKIQQAYHNTISENNCMSAEEFAVSQSTRDQFEEEMEQLNKMAKKVNDSIISDSLRFNGRSPVRHARKFNFEERVREAILEGETNTTNKSD